MKTRTAFKQYIFEPGMDYWTYWQNVPNLPRSCLSIMNPNFILFVLKMGSEVLGLVNRVELFTIYKLLEIGFAC